MVLLTQTDEVKSRGGTQAEELRENCWQTILKRIKWKGFHHKEKKLESIFPKRINEHRHTHNANVNVYKNKQKV